MPCWDFYDWKQEIIILFKLVAYVLYGRPRFPWAVPFVPLSCADLPRSSCVKFFVNEGAITIQKVKFSYKHNMLNQFGKKGLVDQFHKDNLCLH